MEISVVTLFVKLGQRLGRYQQTSRLCLFSFSGRNEYIVVCRYIANSGYNHIPEFGVRYNNLLVLPDFRR